MAGEPARGGLRETMAEFVKRRQREVQNFGHEAEAAALLKPPGISTGDFFETHVRVDPYYHGGKVPAEFGGGSWSGKDLGWTKYDPLGRAWYGSPAPLKAVAGAGLVGAGAAVDQAWNGEGPP